MPPAAGRGPKCLSGEASPGLPGSRSEQTEQSPSHKRPWTAIPLLCFGWVSTPLELGKYEQGSGPQASHCFLDRPARGMPLHSDAEAAWKHHPDGLGEGDFVEPGAQQRVLGLISVSSAP